MGIPQIGQNTYPVQCMPKKILGMYLGTASICAMCTGWILRGYDSAMLLFNVLDA